MLFGAAQAQVLPGVVASANENIAPEWIATDSATWNFSNAAHAYAGSTNLTGYPHTAVKTSTVNGWTLSTVATANWHPYTSNTAYDGSGVTGSFIPGLNSAAYNYYWFNFNTSGSPVAVFDEASPQFRISGLNTAYRYTVRLTGVAAGTAFDANPSSYRAKGVTLLDAQTINGNLTTVNVGGEFIQVQPNGSGQIDIYVNTVSGSSEVAAVCAIQIVEYQ